MRYQVFHTLIVLILTWTPVVAAVEEPTCAGNEGSWREAVFEQILAEDNNALDPTLDGSIAALKKRGAHKCWHKHSTFLDHLVGVHHILHLWGQGQTTARVGLFHSAYSNSYVNLALFDPKKRDERQHVKDLIGVEAENLVHLFCIIDRQHIVVEILLKNKTIPPEGIKVPHLKKVNETVFLSAETLHMLVVFTMADFADQYFGWQDRLFGGDAMVNSMLLTGKDDLSAHESTAIWPGLSQPGLWMSYVSELGAVAKTFQRSDQQYTLVDGRRLNLPPVFDNCTRVLSREDEAKARDLYWSVMIGHVREDEEIVKTIEKSIKNNPWAFEPHVLLAQKYMHANDFENAKQASGRALELQLQWGTAWDKRLSFGAWVAWTRVMYQRAEDEIEWPTNSMDVINFGIVR